MNSDRSDSDWDTESSLTDFANHSNSASSLEFSSETECNFQVSVDRKRRRKTGAEGATSKKWFRAKRIQLERAVLSSSQDKLERLQALEAISLSHKLKSNPKEALKNVG